MYDPLPPFSKKSQRGIKAMCDTDRELRTNPCNVLPCTLTYGHTSVVRSAKMYVHLFLADTECHLEFLHRAMAYRDG